MITTFIFFNKNSRTSSSSFSYLLSSSYFYLNNPHKTNWIINLERHINAVNIATSRELKTGVYYAQTSKDFKMLFKTHNITWNNTYAGMNN